MSYKWDNARRDREYGVPEADAKVDTKELADKVGFEVRLYRHSLQC
jgi:hypothetical protein